MYELVRPEIAIPVHGELMHIHEHIKLAKEWGIPGAIQVSNGDVIKLAPGKASVIDKVESGYLGVDGNFLLPCDSSILKMRRRLQESGIIFVVLMLNNRNKLVMSPVIRAPGVLDMDEDISIFRKIEKEINKSLEGLIESADKRQRSDVVENSVRSSIRKILKQEVGKSPAIDVELIYMDR